MEGARGKIMTDTIRKLILRILDHVEKTPGAHFEIARWREEVVESAKNQMYFEFYVVDKEYRTHYISRDIDKYWSQEADLTEDNLRYLLEQLEGEEK